MSDRFVAALKRAYRRLEEQEWVYGQIGRKVPSGYVLVVPGRPNFVWVTIRIANGAQTVVPARNDAGVKLVEKLSVKMKMEAGNYVIYGKSGRQDIGANVPTPGSGVESHPITEHSDVLITTPSTGEALVFDGTNWENAIVLADVAASITAASTDDTIADADIFGYLTGGVLVKTAWSNIKAVLKTYFDTLYDLTSTAIPLLAAKNPPVDADAVVITDSAASNAPKRVLLTNITTYIMGKITALTTKATPVDADAIIITDSAASDVPKRVTLTNLATWVMAKITALTTKTTPVGADAIVITDSAASDVPKRLTFTNLVTYITSLFMDLTTAQTVATGIKTFTPGIVAPSVDGSVAANGDLTLQGTTHATRTSSYVAIQPNGGHVGVGTATPGVNVLGTFDFDPATTRIFQVDGQGARLVARGSTNVAFDFIQTDGATNAKWFLMQLNGGTAQFISLSDAIAVQKNLLILDLITGNAGFGVTAPQGKLHAYDGAGGFLSVTKTGVVGTPIVIVPNASGDVTRALTAIGNAVGSSGTAFTYSGTFLTVGASNSQNNGAETLRLRVNADGSVDVTRTAGSETYVVTLVLIWS